jgi:hypothetical protein
VTKIPTFVINSDGVLVDVYLKGDDEITTEMMDAGKAAALKAINTFEIGNASYLAMKVYKAMRLAKRNAE